jgi:hypothetical protein
MSCSIGRPSMHLDHPEGPMVCVFPCMMPNRLLRLAWDDQATTVANHARIREHLDTHGAHLSTCVYHREP